MDKVDQLIKMLKEDRKRKEQERINKIYADREKREFNDAHGWRDKI